MGSLARTKLLLELFEAVLRLDTAGRRASAFFRDLCTLGELHDLAQRWAVVGSSTRGCTTPTSRIGTGASTATITRIAQWLHHGEGGYLRALERSHGIAGHLTGRACPMMLRLRPSAIPNNDVS